MEFLCGGQFYYMTVPAFAMHAERGLSLLTKKGVVPLGLYFYSGLQVALCPPQKKNQKKMRGYATARGLSCCSSCMPTGAGALILFRSVKGTQWISHLLVRTGWNCRASVLALGSAAFFESSWFAGKGFKFFACAEWPFAQGKADALAYFSKGQGVQ